MKLYADVTRLIWRHVGVAQHTGIDRVNLEYARWVHEQGGGLCLRRGDEIKQLSRGAWGRLLLGDGQPGNSERGRRHRVLLLLRSLAFRPAIPEQTTLLVSTHSWLAHKGTWAWLAKRRCRAVVFIHDLIPLQFPEYAHPREKALHGRRLNHTLRHSHGIIVNSSCTESAVKAYAKQVGLAVPPILVAPLGHELSVGEKLPTQDSEKPYFVVLGTIEPRKNHLLLLTLWRELVKRHGAATPRLIVVGRRGWECEQVVDLLERCEAIHPYLVEKNDASDEEVVSLLAGACALLMPSYAEGFGMPVQEALAIGTPVISSPLPAIVEFAGNIPDYAEPHDGVRWQELVEDYAKPASLRRAAQLERLPTFRHTTWHEHFQRVEEFLGRMEKGMERGPMPMPGSTIHAVGFSRWKRSQVRAFFQDSNVIFVRKPSQLPKQKSICVVTWGIRISNEQFPTDAQIIRLEDGFLRSVGLGADLVRPLSWVRDGRGIYYDATQPSDLEMALRYSDFHDSLIQRARTLREQIVAAELTKYNTGAGAWLRPEGVKCVILVPGQVESDASIQRGAAGIKTNLDLLKEVRRKNPDAYIVYKPHPDVVAGLRTRGSGESNARECCDEVVGDVAMGALLAQVDEVHTLTSLSGFEALMRGKKVVAYGMPFYAGWGLTQDPGLSAAVAARRGRLLTLDELVAGALILYPTYVSLETGRFTTPEGALRELLDWRDKQPVALPAWRQVLRFFLRQMAW